MLRYLLALLLLMAPAQAETRAEDRVALVFGMAAYQNVTALKNTVNDATALARTLEQIGFRVDVQMDATREETLAALDKFAFEAETADIALIYYAGHGVSVQGTTFLIPVDAKVLQARDIVAASVTMDQMLAAVDGARKMSVVILDSCRDNPFPDVIDLRDPEVAKGLTTGSGGLAPPSPERGTLVAYAARDGEVALDGTGANSPFNIALRDNMVKPNLEISLLFRQVRDEVLAATGNRQEPTVYGSLPGEPFYLTADADAAGSSEPGVEELAVAWQRVVAADRANLEKSAAAGDSRSLVGLALAKLDRQSTDYAPQEAQALLEQAVAAGDPDAKYRLAKVLEGGLGVDPDPKRALALYEEAAEANIPAALNDMGYFHFTGALGLTADRDAALALFREAAAQGHSEAMFNVASFAANGLVPDLGPKDAADLLYRALRGGSDLALDGLLNNADKFPKETWAGLQAILAEKGLYDGPVDGSFGPGTRRAVLAAYGIFETED
ncbi:MAG: caspase family protein [Tabrizicola sp.]|uniref:caspase family protein n=1 Tax=Tabrizicola sp. TaxID=2005166 RepID=UPI001B580B68|nr:caspase family protein [Tabrizicola sp.]MCC6517414.1 caspase family protein [Tabrizicola sp.]